ncbi:thiamine pyrophosphate-binding protein, partial [Streptomyces sp. NPDC004658]|uniref:thiamine pyrophosphate-binding protein n=1 Tax=Streptomyces sp. NPDC004658 TaxID=3154672 RepID=UPI0033A4B4A1
MVNVAGLVAARLRHLGVDRVYGTPGLAVDPLIGALRGAPAAPGFVQARGEESTALMGCAQAKLTGGLGCCAAPSGAGVLRLSAGLYDAAADRVTVLALVGADPAPWGPGSRAAPSGGGLPVLRGGRRPGTRGRRPAVWRASSCPAGSSRRKCPRNRPARTAPSHRRRRPGSPRPTTSAV